MTGADLQALAPHLVLIGGTLVLLLAISFVRRHDLALGILAATID